MVQVGNELNYPTEEESILTRLTFQVGSRSHGQAVQITRANEVIPVGGKTVKKGPLLIATGANSAYTALDIFGDKFKLEGIPKSGIIQGLQIFDAGDQLSSTNSINVWLFNADFAVGTDNAAFDVTDADMAGKLETVVLIDSFFDAINSKVGREDNLGIAYTAPSGSLWGICQSISTPTIAAGEQALLSVYILADE